MFEAASAHKKIVATFQDRDDKPVGDCGEVLTIVAQVKPKFVSPYADQFIPLLNRIKKFKHDFLCENFAIKIFFPVLVAEHDCKLQLLLIRKTNS